MPGDKKTLDIQRATESFHPAFIYTPRPQPCCSFETHPSDPYSKHTPPSVTARFTPSHYRNTNGGGRGTIGESNIKLN